MTTDLIVAAARGDEAAVARLIEGGGAAANSRDDQGETALHKAVNGGHPSTAALLLAHGASHTLADAKGQTPFDADHCPPETLHTIRQHYQRFKLEDGPSDAPAESRRWAADLERDGIVRARGLISPEELSNLRDELATFADRMARRVARGKKVFKRYDQEEHFRAKDQAFTTNNAFKYSPRFARFCCNPKLLATVNLYLGKPAFIQRSIAMRYLPSPPLEEAQFGWHHDMEEKRFKTMVLLTDVGEDDQCMSYVLGSHKLFHPYAMFFKNQCSLDYRRDNLGQPGETGELDIFNASGQAGDVFFFDTNGAHRGNRRELAQIRDVFQAEYSADKSNFWGANIAEPALQGLPSEATKPFEHILTSPKKWDLHVRRRQPNWVETLPKVETWI